MIKPIIRSATAADLPRCLSFDPSFETDYVWQMDSRPQEGQINVSFRTVRLPRPMKVTYPRDVKQLNAGWQACDAMLVADDNRTVVGYAALAKRGAQAAAWVQDLIVTKTARRTGVGSALLAGASSAGRGWPSSRGRSGTSTRRARAAGARSSWARRS